MPIIPLICPNCGGKLEIDSENDAAICEHCGKPFVVKDAIVNNYIQKESKISEEERIENPLETVTNEGVNDSSPNSEVLMQLYAAVGEAAFQNFNKMPNDTGVNSSSETSNYHTNETREKANLTKDSRNNQAYEARRQSNSSVDTNNTQIKKPKKEFNSTTENINNQINENRVKFNSASETSNNQSNDKKNKRSRNRKIQIIVLAVLSINWLLFHMAQDGLISSSFFDSSTTTYENNYSEDREVKETDNGLAVFKNGKVDTSFSGLIEYEDEWIYVENGYANSDFLGIFENEDEIWYIEKGKFRPEANGTLTLVTGESVIIENGKVIEGDYTNSEGKHIVVRDGKIT